MKKMLLILFFLFFSALAAHSPNNHVLTIANLPSIRPFETLFQATAWVESSNNPDALNRLEKAVGIIQVRPIRLKDYNQKTGNHLKLKEMYDPIKAKNVFMYYAMEIGINQEERIAREWNGGEKGMKKRSTIKYYEKIKKYL